MFEPKWKKIKDLDPKTVGLLTKLKWDNFDLEDDIEKLIDQLASYSFRVSNQYDDLSDQYDELEKDHKNEITELKQAHSTKIFSIESKYKEEIAGLNAKIYDFKQDRDLLTKENKILEARMDCQDSLLEEISELTAKNARLEGEISEKDKKFELLKEIYDNPRVEKIEIVHPEVVEPRIIEPKVLNCKK